jgi:hypothetical protein
MTGAMYANLKRLAGTKRQVADVIRESLREYLDNQGELAGSRRYFSGRFRDEVHALRSELGWHQTLNTILMAEMYSVLILNLVEMDEEAAKSFTPSSILKVAEERMIESGWRVRTRVEAATTNAQSEEQRQLDSGEQ